jgi:tricorn protease interacting factor F2/3
MAYKAIDHAHPEWKIWESFCNGEPTVETQAGAMERDFLRNTHPIQVRVDSPDEIEQIFDEISYGKGAHVLQMIDAYVGEESFREGVVRYLSAHAYSNATGDDLWSAVEQASGKPVKRIMSAWVRQPGFPVVTVHLDDGRLKLTQERLLISGRSEKVTWPIPLTVEANGQRKSILMENPAVDVEVNSLKSLRINPNRTGFYAADNRTVDDIIWRSEPSEYDRWGLIFDAFLFLVSGTMKFNEYLSALKRFGREDEALPAREISDQLQLLYTLAPSKITEVSKRLHHDLLEKFKIKSDEKSSILRGILASRLALIDSEYAANLAPGFKEYGTVAPDMRSAVAIAYARSTNDIENMVSEYRKSGSDEDKNKLLSAMTVFSEEKLVQRTLNFAVGGEVKRQDVLQPVFGAAVNPHVRSMVWGWLKSEIGKLQEIYQGTGRLSLVFAEIIPRLCLGRGAEAESFFAEHMIPDAETGIKVGLEKLHAYDQLAKEIMGHA